MAEEAGAAAGGSTPESVPVIIAGAGPVGLSLALGLAVHGVRSVVLEKKSELSRHSKALGVLTRTLEIFRSWGVLDRFLSAGTLLNRVAIHSARDNSVLARLNLGVLERLTATPGVLVLPQDRTEALLLEKVLDLGLSDVRFGHSLRSFQQDGDGVTVEVAGPGGERSRLRGKYLVGCDGPHSTVRAQLGWHLEGRTYPARMMLADVRFPDERGDLPWPRIFPMSRGALAGIRYAPRTWRIISTVSPGEGDEEAVSRAGVAGRVEKLFGPGEFESLWSEVFRIHRRLSPRFRQGKVVLAGDAAHINSPAGGQGMNSGIQDAHNLAWKLAFALRGGDEEALLTSYEEERRGAVEKNVERFTDLLTRLVLLSGPLIRSTLGAVAPILLARRSVMRRVAPRAGMLDIRYGASSLLQGRDPLIGRRAPDGELVLAGGKRVPLLDLVGPRALLLLFDDGTAPARQGREALSAASDLPEVAVCRILPAGRTPGEGEGSDAGGMLWTDWCARGGLCALIRPDGYVGWVSPLPRGEELRKEVRQALGLGDRMR